VVDEEEEALLRRLPVGVNLDDELLLDEEDVDLFELDMSWRRWCEGLREEITPAVVCRCGLSSGPMDRPESTSTGSQLSASVASRIFFKGNTTFFRSRDPAWQAAIGKPR
jgi:hypothetical protein